MPPAALDDHVFSSSPAFATPLHPIPTKRAPPINLPTAKDTTAKPPTILPIRLPPGTLRPHAFRIFTKKHNLTLASTALTHLADFVGRHCGSGWREEGLAEPVLEEIAKAWKKESGSVIVDGKSQELQNILKTLDGCMSGGRVIQGKTSLSRQSSFAFGDKEQIVTTRKRPLTEEDVLAPRKRPSLENQSLEEDLNEEEVANTDPRNWLQVIQALEQPKWIYDTRRKNFERRHTKPSLLPSLPQRIEMFQQRYNLIHQRLMRDESFQAPTISTTRSLLSRSASSIAQSHKITPIVNLLGRSGTKHLLLGLLTLSPAGDLTLSDTSGSITLDLQYTRPVPEEGAYFTPGMVVIVDGQYVENYGGSSGGATDALGSTGGIGGTIGGRFIGSIIGHPPTERRAQTLGIDSNDNSASGPAFGWTDFLGLGSERATGIKMRRLQSRMLSETPDTPTSRTGKIAIAAEVVLDSPNTLSALKAMLSTYSSQPTTSIPLAIVLMGNFSRTPPLTGVLGASSIEYKESFNQLASVLAEFPQVTGRTTFVFVPGDKDAWAGAGASGGSTAIPQKPIPEVFTSRIRRSIANASKEEGTGSGTKWKGGEAVWATNPARLTHFGTAGELVLFRDDIDGRMRRVSVPFNKDEDEEDDEGPDQSGPRENGDEQPADELMSTANPGDSQSQSQSQPQSQSQVSQLQAKNQSEKDDSDIKAAKRLIRTVVDQGHLSPFPINTRPVQWDHSHVLSLYPLPSALVLADSEMAPFSHNYMGCCVMNPSTLVPSGRRGGLEARWIEYSILEGKGSVKTAAF